MSESLDGGWLTQILVGAILVGAVVPTAGAEPADPDPRDCVGEAAGDLAPGESVTLDLEAGERVQGRFQGLDRDRALLRLRIYDRQTSRFSEREIPFHSVERLSHRSSPGWLIPLGAAIGAAAVLVPSLGSEEDYAPLLVVYTPVGLLAGGLGGWLASLCLSHHRSVNCAGG